MAVSLKRWLVVMALATALLGSMFGWALHMNAAAAQHPAHLVPTHQTAMVPQFVCPPPPFECI